MMGYTTEFQGQFKFNKPLTAKMVAFLKSFSEEDHREGTTPGIWCQWIPTDDGEYLEWDGGEKFYEYVEWLEYLIKEFLAQDGYVLNGEVKWRGEEFNDLGTIVIKDNKVETK